ncbi:LOW QUALITY PROTEIN: hypothetical protein BDA96_06G127900 [Sorghum bicolor]|uniref:C2H2-type domain-containing protein n=1 Tax=Sorghum bicolor TaxID=4558 RepID=A0A921QR30_SORBI|nr:LOW QUALITY PROTEIN: hypothetical protein BDA96_06G127900 [Sorghum bicolor]
MNSRAYQFQLQAAEAAAPVVHAAEGGETEVTTMAPPLLKIEAQGTAADEPASRQGSGGLAPTTMGTIVNAEALATKCPECPKWFASEKAMFGHLRKHPERGYKGATRPTMATASAAAAAAVVGDKKPTKKVPRKQINMAAVAAAKAWEEGELSTRWPASVKRGRTPVAPVQASSCSEEEEAAMILLELASSSRTSSETQQQQSVEPARAPDAVSGYQIQTSVVEEPMLLDYPAGHQSPEAAEQQIVQPENALALSAESQTPAVKQVTDLVITTEAVLIVVPVNNKPIVFPSLDSGAAGDKKATKKQRRVTNPEQTAASPPPPEGGAVVRTPPARRIPSPASDKKHTCLTCGKSFPTHQALGGHMANHVKGSKTTSARHDDLAEAQAKRNIAELTHRDQSAGNGNVIIAARAGEGAMQERQDAQPPPAQAPTPQDAKPPPAQAQAPTPKAAAPHVCDECHLIFPSGQALGGHKRKHWFPEKQQAKAASAPAPAPALAPRDFDLNEMPMEEQGENNNDQP